MGNRTGKIRAAAQAASLSKVLTSSRTIGAGTIAVLIFLATVVSFTQSYRGLLDFASNYLLIPRPFNWTWPLMVDTFLAVGEICLFIGAVDGEKSWRLRGWFWTLTLAGLVASVTGNIMHNGLNEPGLRMAGYAVPPIAAMAILGAGLGLVKRAVAKAKAAAELTHLPKPKVIRIEHTEESPSRPNVFPIGQGAKRPHTGGRRKMVETNPAVQEIVQEISNKILNGQKFTGRGIHAAYGLSRGVAIQVLEAATSMAAQEAASG
jgi:hypothetical protein